MKTYYSCLFPIFQELYSFFANKEFSKINAVEIDSSEHLKTFLLDLRNDHSKAGIEKAIQKALKSSEHCNLCIECKKCSQFFYLQVAQLIYTDYESSELPELYRSLALAYGNLSFRKPPISLSHHFDSHNTLWDYYNQQLTQNNYNRTITNNLIILKGMSSSSPYIYNNVYQQKNYTGGGLYVNWDGYGIAIDPGYGFVENMHKNKIGIQDINAVIITHFHIDHTNDMRIIDDLNHQFQQSDHHLHWFMDKTSFDTLHHGLNPKTNIIRVLSSTDFSSNISITDKISIKPFHTQHVKNDSNVENTPPYATDTFGFTLRLSASPKHTYRIGYTSDTAYYDGLESALETCDVLVANISGIYLKDYLLLEQKKRHLGYMGCYHLINKIQKKPKIMIISEFWNGTTDIRFDICKTLSEEFLGEVPKIIPGDIGLHINVPNASIKCSQCGKYESISNIYTIRCAEDFDSLLYVCKNCMF